MRLPLTWVREYLDLDEAAEVVAERLDLTGTAVEAIHRDAPGFDNVVVGKIVSVAKHPNADRLTYDEVDVGTHIAKIVCGAPNIAAGQTVPVALPGATLPNGMTIERRAVRGVESEGMMCAEDELGLGTDHAGIVQLDNALAAGTPLSEALGIGDTVLELEITPNRPDCLSIKGLARELGAVFSREVRYPTIEPTGTAPPAADLVRVEIEDPVGCPRYAAMVVEGVTIGPSPDGLAGRLRAMGARPINNVVDVTNYVMFELGQPLHAFDYDKVVDGRIIVRRARDGERLETLDGVERELDKSMLVITDPSGPVALAGVMGGASTEVSDATTRILLEGANFDPPLIMRTSRGMGLLSESSARFEKGVDPNGAADAVRRAASLMAQLGGGTVREGVVDVYPSTIERRTLTLRPERVNRVLGTDWGEKRMAGVLSRLDLEVTLKPDPTLGTAFSVVVPTSRPDLEREIDLVEEIARLVGLSEIPSTLPRGAGRVGRLDRAQRLERELAQVLRSAGVSEAASMGFVDPADVDALKWPMPAGAEPVQLKNPIAADQRGLRPTILVELIRAAQRNQSVGEREIALYEMGRVWPGTWTEDLPVEERRLAIVLSGGWQGRVWHSPVEPFDAYDLVGVLQDVGEGLRLAGWRLAAMDHPSLMRGTGLAVWCGERQAGVAGRLGPDIASAFDVEGPVFAAELDLAAITDAAREVGEFTPPARLPAVTRDLAIVVNAGVRAADLIATAKAAGAPLLAEIDVFDVYRGPGIGAGKKSIGLALAYRAPGRTLVDAEVDVLDGAVMKALADAHGAVRR